MSEELDPWLRDQKGELGDGYIVVDGVTLPGVLAKEVTVTYPDSKEWPIRLTVNFYLDELEVDPKVAEFVAFVEELSGPKDLEE